jgi:hypothetical protein
MPAREAMLAERSAGATPDRSADTDEQRWQITTATEVFSKVIGDGDSSKTPPAAGDRAGWTAA